MSRLFYIQKIKPKDNIIVVFATLSMKPEVHRVVSILGLKRIILKASFVRSTFMRDIFHGTQ